jgi:lipid-A-disaccharide synthase
MKYYLIAGERSGDLHGSNLIRALKAEDPEARFRGFGGDAMQSAGLDLMRHYRELAFMGVLAVITNLGKIRKALSQCKADILAWQPDVIILIDYAGFNLRIAHFARHKGIRVFYYISPKVWAWNRSRVYKLKESVDRMFCILPFEKEFFEEYGWRTDYVGNPVLDAVRAFRPRPDFRKENDLPESDLVALLPGSRKGEVERVLPILADLVSRHPKRNFVVAGVTSLPGELYAPVRRIPNVSVVFDRTYDLLAIAQSAIVTSGTATLETALFRVPQVVVYKTHPVEYAIGSRLVKVDFISLVNLIAGREVVKELLQEAATVDRVNREFIRIAEDRGGRENMLNGYGEVLRKLDTGSASENTARLMVGYLGA